MEKYIKMPNLTVFLRLTRKALLGYLYCYKLMSSKGTMKSSFFYFKAVLAVVIVAAVSLFYKDSLVFPEKNPSKAELITHSLYDSTYWDKDYLDQHHKTVKLAEEFYSGKLCPVLKTIALNSLSHSEIIKKLLGNGYKFIKSPLRRTPNKDDKTYLRLDDVISNDPDDPLNAYQETLWKDNCMVRIKPVGFPHYKRNYPHFTVAILSNTGDPSYDSEIGKITGDGQLIPKSPYKEFGMAACPYHDKKLCSKWIDEIMEKAHHTLKYHK